MRWGLKKKKLPVERHIFEFCGLEPLCGRPRRLGAGIYATDLIPHKSSTSCLSPPPPSPSSVICNVMS